MPRLFVAVDLLEDIKAALSDLCKGHSGIRWLSPDHLHLTIRFIGEVDEIGFAAIRDGLTGEGLAAFTCFLKGVGYFPPKGRPKVIWAAVHATEGLLKLHTKVESGLRSLGVSAKENKFVPHVTLARLNNIKQSEAASHLGSKDLFQTRTFSIKNFNLYSSVLTAKGAIHTLEHSYVLP